MSGLEDADVVTMEMRVPGSSRLDTLVGGRGLSAAM
eukprot:CAMPEP_0179127754 /NCGR_PEP_ID=MMETSP0796-20121207/60538_1 /TAXON_ID=73915 /ORGANISM="Pyrodinium bahamense, Strain pbaha01" /LENGTH=35 /DNA_ID= /DNA_START= /DNA_END= /DNA_ORIENTATION=